MNKTNVEENDVLWALETAERKIEYTKDTWKKRSKNQRFVDIFVGDLAKNIIKTELLKANKKMENYLIEYDKIRKDDFKYSDKFDLSIKLKSEDFDDIFEYSLEIKSSVEKKVKDIDTVLKCRNVIVNKGGSHESYSDFVFQVFYIPNDLKWFKDFSDGEMDNLNFNECKQQIREKFSKHVSIYPVGFITSNEINNKNKTFSVDNVSKNDKERKYLSFPITEVNDMSSFRDVLGLYHHDRKVFLFKKNNKSLNKEKNKGIIKKTRITKKY